MRRNYLFSIILAVAVLGKVTNVSAQNVTYACNTVNISIADIIGIVDTASNQIDVFTEETAFNMGIVSFEYPNALFYGTSQTESSGSCYVSASTPLPCNCESYHRDVQQWYCRAPVDVLEINGTTNPLVTVTPFAEGALSTSYQFYATGGTGQ